MLSSVHCVVKQIGSCKRSFFNLAASATQHQKLHSQTKWFSFSEETKTSLKNITQIKNAPASALVYGVSGLIPFTAIPAFMYQTSMFVPELAYAQLAYSAVILSFLGGVRWGSSISNPEALETNFKNLGLSVAPSLAGWASLLVNNSQGLMLAMTGFYLCMVQDMKSSHYPSWYKSLRIILSSIVVLSLLATLLAERILPLEEKTSGNSFAA